MRTLIKGRKLIDGKGNAIEGAAVLMDGDRITAVGRQADVTAGEGVASLDVGDNTIMPGLVDAHVHLVNTVRTARRYAALGATPSSNADGACNYRDAGNPE